MCPILPVPPPPPSPPMALPLYGDTIQPPSVVPMSLTLPSFMPPLPSMPGQKKTQLPVDIEETQVQGAHFLKRYQKWDPTVKKWLPYDPTQEDAALPRSDHHNYFYLNVRYPADGGKQGLVLSDFSDVLKDYLREVMGGLFLMEVDPHISLAKFVFHINDFQASLKAARDALSESNMSLTTLQETAHSLGYAGNSEEATSAETYRDYLSKVVEQLEVLLFAVQKEYENVEHELTLQISHGQIAFHLLDYYFKKDVEYVAEKNGQKLAFTLTEAYHAVTKVVTNTRLRQGKDLQQFAICGTIVEWRGESYDPCIQVSYTIDKYDETMPLASLPCQILTDDVRDTLKERGTKYVSLAGVHYMLYDECRVVVDRRAWDEYRPQPQPPQVRNTSSKTLKPTSNAIDTCPEDKLHLLPPAVCGFNLRHKEWQEFDVRLLEPIHYDNMAWDHLVLEPDTKLLIKSLVSATVSKNMNGKIMSDVITGKGGGLITVLHGTPGTGKTLTAEAIAEHLRRPLYNINSMELSTNPSELEKNLKRVLDLSQKWNAILLIDEADVFLEQRSLNELLRNSLVSVALRLFEYHKGVIFLTTNRIQVFDDAFLSRFSIAIKYPDLDQPSRFAIWQKFFELAENAAQDPINEDAKQESFQVEGIRGRPLVPLQEIDEFAKYPFNGRTIKNIVRTAQALALAANEPLTSKHVNIVVRAQEKFMRDFAAVRST